MRFRNLAVLLLVLFGSGFYLYSQVEAVCKIPLTYRIGHIDNRFDITFDEARVAIADAESVWEQATGQNLFTYDPEGELVVNFVFDDRQEFALAEVDFREQLNTAEYMNDEIRAAYEALIADYDEREAIYEDGVAAYEARLAAYNEKVNTYNEAGGAPPDVYAELQAERTALDQELTELHRQGRELNRLAGEINTISEEGNQLVEQYNENVGNYNETFGESREFTQGDYRNGQINIYKFIDMNELELVLAHELGHALSLDHVTGEASIMYHLMGGQPVDMALTEPDLVEFERVCGRTAGSWVERVAILFGT